MSREVKTFSSLEKMSLNLFYSACSRWVSIDTLFLRIVDCILASGLTVFERRVLFRGLIVAGGLFIRLIDWMFINTGPAMSLLMLEM